MTQEDRELLLKDLSARLPYGIKIAIEYTKGKYTHIYDLRKIDNDTTSELRQRVIVWNYGLYNSVISYPLIDCRPYLRPLSSMTEEDNLSLSKYVRCNIKVIYGDIYFPNIENNTLGKWEKVFEWLNANYFDYHGLIEKGLAIAITKENNPYKD